MLAALADPVRLRLLSLVAAQDEVCSCDLEVPLGKSQPTVSHHTRVLSEAGLLVGERGRWMWWRVEADRLAAVRKALASSISYSKPFDAAWRTDWTDVRVIVVDVDAFGVAFIRDLHTVFPSMRIVALTSGPRQMIASLKTGVSRRPVLGRSPSSAPSPV